MQRFQFRLETLLKFRRIQKEQAQIKFSEALNKLHTEQELLLDLENKLAESMDALRSRQQEQKLLTLETLKVFSNYFDRIKSDIIIQNEKVTEADGYCKECLAALEEAVKKSKLVEKLRVKRLQQYQADALHEEQKILDEMAMQIYIRN